MPKASVDENRDSPRRKHDIWSPWQVLPMKPVSQPGFVKVTSDQELRSRIFRANTGHDLAAFSVVENIHISNFTVRDLCSVGYKEVNSTSSVEIAVLDLNFVDLFSCGGGMSSGFSRQGSFRAIGAADLEVAKPSHGVGATSCNDTYEENIGLRPMATDLATTPPAEIGAHFGFTPSDVDVLISCAPCTGFSQKNSRNHIRDDSRNRLVERTALYAAEWQPRYVVIENVKELLRGRHMHHYQGLHKRLTDLGYEVSAEIHNLMDFGLPQSRVRSLIIAKLGGSFQPDWSTVEPHRTVRDAIEYLPPINAGETSPDDPMHTSPNMTDRSLERMQAIPKDGGSWTDLTQHQAHLRIPSMNVEKPGSFPDIYGRLAWDKVSPTVTRECSHPGNGRYCHPEQDRLLSVREMALIQGFPADYRFLGSLSFKYRQIGDAVPPTIATMIAEAISADANGKVFSTKSKTGQLQLTV
jgi:DNA (cytosine-5)-methyltransferase 1